jgi:hypothetical protein
VERIGGTPGGRRGKLGSVHVLPFPAVGRALSVAFPYCEQSLEEELRGNCEHMLPGTRSCAERANTTGTGAAKRWCNGRE